MLTLAEAFRWIQIGACVAVGIGFAEFLAALVIFAWRPRQVLPTGLPQFLAAYVTHCWRQVTDADVKDYIKQFRRNSVTADSTDSTDRHRD